MIDLNITRMFPTWEELLALDTSLTVRDLAGLRPVLTDLFGWPASLSFVRRPVVFIKLMGAKGLRRHIDLTTAIHIAHCAGVEEVEIGDRFLKRRDGMEFIFVRGKGAFADMLLNDFMDPACRFWCHMMLLASEMGGDFIRPNTMAASGQPTHQQAEMAIHRKRTTDVNTKAVMGAMGRHFSTRRATAMMRKEEEPKATVVGP